MSEVKEWWCEFFAGPWSDIHGSLFSREQTASETDRIEALLGLEAGSRVLDVPTGEGRVARELARRGHRVTAVDLSRVLLEQGRRLAEREGLTIDWLEADMRDFTVEPDVDAAITWWGSFGYFDAEGDLAMMRRVYDVLRPGGRFLVDVHIAETLLRVWQSRDFSRIGDAVVLHERQYDTDTGRLETSFTYLVDGREIRRQSSMYLYSKRELAALFRRVGFDDVQTFDAATREPWEFPSGGAHAIMVGRKSE